jgi:sulfoxide reductase heme-binding subunit YedZ
MFLLTWHIWAIMAHHWTYLTPIGIGAMLIIIVLFLYRQWIVQHQAKKRVAQ